MESSSIIGTETVVSKALSLTPLNSWLFKCCLGGSDSDGKAGRLLSDPWYRHMMKAPCMAALPPLVCKCVNEKQTANTVITQTKM